MRRHRRLLAQRVVAQASMMIRNRGAMRDIETARKLRETFMDRPPARQTIVPWEWPRTLQEVGIGEAITYSSDKWKKNGEHEDYKHVAEGPQRVWVRPDYLVLYENPSTRLEVVGPSKKLRHMPDSFAVLADATSVQLRLYKGTNSRHVVPNPDDNLWQVNLAKTKLGGARFRNGDAFLVFYTSSGVDMIIVGDELDILKDGIVG
jgi:hypothetical protein